MLFSLAHKHEHEHKQNKHVRFSSAYALVSFAAVFRDVTQRSPKRFLSGERCVTSRKMAAKETTYAYGLCANENSIRQISGFVLLMFLLMLTLMLRVFSLVQAYALVRTSLKCVISKQIKIKFLRGAIRVINIDLKKQRTK